MVENLNEVLSNEVYYDEFKSADVILIEELQFFEDVSFVIKAAEEHNKKIIASGLDGDFRRQPFKSVISLISYADNVTKLKSFCKMCSDGTPGIFSKRIVKSDSYILVGGSDTYMSVCRKHYLK